MDGFLKGKCIPCDLKVNETNAEYLVRKFAEAEAKCAALAAENAELKSVHPQPFGAEMMKALDEYEKHQDEVPETGMLNAFFILRDSIRVETPATDSFLSEVRAQGVEMMREHPSIKLCSLTHICDELAAQLRKGGNQ
ncbi:hypothetical protein [Escherichia coli]|nr:hypothetical protein [Escherichia coli]